MGVAVLDGEPESGALAMRGKRYTVLGPRHRACRYLLRAWRWLNGE